MMLRLTVALCAAATLGTFGGSAGADPVPSEPAFDAFEQIAAHFTDARFDVASHIVNATGTHDNVLRISYRKPHFARCEVIDGPGAGGVAVWRGGDKVLVRPPGLLSRFALAFDRNDAHVVDSRGRGCGQSNLDTFASQFSAHGTIEEIDGPTIDGSSTTEVIWKSDGSDTVGDTKRELFLSKASHLPLEIKDYHRDQLVEDSHYRNIALDTKMPFSEFEL